ncbi:ATP-binding protein [Nonomuraea sp. SYSU D8015]|uniref:ATP-binding protein n=1 Tax=Nonomuraea sp. SYSU D8015 TaxID=2593644 RepID=UPI0016604B99|nr:helix-turn-helix transcriptional regulator [Nonomuraea sp. SYSU D8015]
MFVGREAELQRLAAAQARTPAAVLVVGEAGIGKSRLVREFVGGIDALVAEGGADPGGTAYAPFVPVLRRLVREYSAGLVPGGGRSGLARLLPELGEVAELPGIGRARLFEEVLLLVERAAERRPLVLVLEDLHWADPATRDLLVFLLRNLMRPGVLVIATSREQLRLPGAELVRVPPLARDEVARMLGWNGAARHPDDGAGQAPDGIAGRAPRDGAELDVIVARSEGNPLFVEALADAGAGAATPASLRELLLAGADRLDRRSLGVLRIAAVAGRRIPHDVLAAVAGLDELAFDEALRPIVRARLLLVDGDGYAFRHALIRDAVYDDLLPGERRRLHARCAESWPEPAADHWYAAGDRRRAFEAAWQAARWDRVLELWDEGDTGGRDHAWVLEQAARDALCEGDAERAEELATRALDEVADPLRAAHLLELRVAVRDLLGDLGTASRLYAEFRASPPDDDSLLMSYASEADVLEAAGEHAKAESVARAGLARAGRLGMARTRGAHLAANLAEPLVSLGRWKEAREVMTAALALDPAPIHRAWILMVLGTLAVWEGALDEADDIIRLARPLMRGRSRGYDSCLEPDLLECRLAVATADAERAGRVTDHVLAEHDLRLSRRYAWPLLALAARIGRVREAPAGISITGPVQEAYRATFEAECGGSWAAAVARWRAVGQPHALGQALVRAAEQDPAEARGLLREAAAIADRLCAEPLRREVESAATTLRVGLTTDPALSARELEVLGLVAEGLSNRQIAERLFISARTSGVHVSNILAKLGASSRVEAAALARRDGLI